MGLFLILQISRFRPETLRQNRRNFRAFGEPRFSMRFSAIMASDFENTPSGPGLRLRPLSQSRQPIHGALEAREFKLRIKLVDG